VDKRSPKAIKLPNHQHIAGAEGIVLQVDELGAIGFGGTGVSDQHF
jgi:hypothetical protein